MYTVNQEAKYLAVRNVPALNIVPELLHVFSEHGELEEYKHLEGQNPDQFTECYHLKFASIPDARQAKIKLNKAPFYGNLLQVSYMPELETFEETLQKLETRRTEIQYRLNRA